MQLQVNTNGALTFDGIVQNYTGETLSMIRTALIAVFWADIDTRGSGEVFYRQTNESYSVANVTESIHEAFEGADDFVPTTLFIATWKSVGYFDRNADQVCIFWYHDLPVRAEVYCGIHVCHHNI